MSQHGNTKVETKDTDVEINDTQVKTYTNVETNDSQATTKDDESDKISIEPTTVSSLFLLNLLPILVLSWRQSAQ